MHTYSNNILNIDIHILYARYVELDSRWYADNITSPYTRIYMVTEGCGNISCHGKEYSLVPGYIYVIPAGLRFSFHCTDKLCKTFFHISIPTPEGYDLLERLDHPVEFSSPEQITRITSALAEHSVQSILEIKSCLYQLVGRCLAETSPITLRKYSEYVTKIIHYVNHYPNASLTADTIARALLTSTSRLRSTFRAETGTPIGTYIHDRVLYYAELQVRCSTKSIKEISESLGYCDQFYFSRCFARKFGLSPAKYRERINI